MGGRLSLSRTSSTEDAGVVSNSNTAKGASAGPAKKKTRVRQTARKASGNSRRPVSDAAQTSAQAQADTRIAGQSRALSSSDALADSDGSAAAFAGAHTQLPQTTNKTNKSNNNTTLPRTFSADVIVIDGDDDEPEPERMGTDHTGDIGTVSRVGSESSVLSASRLLALSEGQTSRRKTARKSTGRGSSAAVERMDTGGAGEHAGEPGRVSRVGSETSVLSDSHMSSSGGQTSRKKPARKTTGADRMDTGSAGEQGGDPGTLSRVGSESSVLSAGTTARKVSARKTTGVVRSPPSQLSLAYSSSSEDTAASPQMMAASVPGSARKCSQPLTVSRDDSASESEKEEEEEDDGEDSDSDGGVDQLATKRPRYQLATRAPSSSVASLELPSADPGV